MVCDEGSDGVCNSYTASSLFRSPRSQEKMSTSCSSVKWMPVGKGMVFGTREGEILLPVLPVEPWVVWFRDACTGSLLPFDSPSRSMGEGGVGPVQAASSGSVCVSHWDFSFAATAVGGILGGVPCGEAFIMVWLIAQRRISTPASNLGYGTTGVAGAPGGFLGECPSLLYQ